MTTCRQSDVTDLLRKGENKLEVTLGNGFANCQSRDAWGLEKAPCAMRKLYPTMLRYMKWLKSLEK